MNENSKLVPAIIVVGIVALAFGTLGGLIWREISQEDEPLKGVPVSHEYQATTTAEMTGALVKATEYSHLIASSTHGTVILGSIVVASTTDAALVVYNATSTAAVTDGAYSPLVTRLPSSTPQGTYVFDAELNYGMVVQLKAGFAGDYVFIWRK